MTTLIQTDTLTVKITPNDAGNPPGKLADAEVHFAGGPLEGMKLIGFAIWERQGSGARNVTFPARQYAVNGERRSYAPNAASTPPTNDRPRPSARPRRRGPGRRTRSAAADAGARA